MEACKSEQEGQRREKEDQLYEELEGLKAQLDEFERRNSALDGETLFLTQQPVCLFQHALARHCASKSTASVDI